MSVIVVVVELVIVECIFDVIGSVVVFDLLLVLL